MNVVVPKGKYVIAVSGGVDSVVLLDILVKQPDISLVVAHFDHGIRQDSAADEQFVRELAAQYKLPYVSEHGTLGADASEDEARQARYAFLRRVVREEQAAAMLTAHHQDDVLETAIFNMLRGTGRRGLTSLASTQEIQRPLLQISKREILGYAKEHVLTWHEDSTNSDMKYARNYIRHSIMPRLSAEDRQKLTTIIANQRAVNKELDELLHLDTLELDRRWFVSLSHKEASEVMASWLRSNGLAAFDRPLIEQLVVQAKTRAVGKHLDVQRGAKIAITSDKLLLHKTHSNQ